MDQRETAAIMGELSKLFEAFQTFGKTATLETVAVYLTAIEGCTLPGLRSAVTRLVRGEAPEHNGVGTPSTAILARLVRYEDQRIVLEARRDARPRIASAKVIELPITPEARERGKAVIAAMLAGDHDLARSLVRDGAE